MDFADAAKRTPLMFAAFQGHGGVVQFLVERGAALNLISGAEFTALDYALKGVEVAIAKFLHGRGAKLGDIASVMSFICEKGEVELVKIALTQNPPLDTLDGNGITGLHYAAIRGHTAVAALLLEKGAGVDVKAKNGKTALGFAQGAGNAELIALLQKHGAQAV